MGEVYRAHDDRLGRDVALKVLPDDFAGDPERISRFEREARVLASLTHANIAAIYGLEEGAIEGGRTVRALVLELVEGETQPIDSSAARLCSMTRCPSHGRSPRRWKPPMIRGSAIAI